MNVEHIGAWGRRRHHYIGAPWFSKHSVALISACHSFLVVSIVRTAVLYLVEKKETIVPTAMAGAYGILRVDGLVRTNSGWGRNPRFAKPKTRSPVPWNKSPRNPPA